MGRPRRAAVIETLHDVAATIQTEETATGVCERTVSAAANLLNFNQCTVLVREGEWLVRMLRLQTHHQAAADGWKSMRDWLGKPTKPANPTRSRRSPH